MIDAISHAGPRSLVDGLLALTDVRMAAASSRRGDSSSDSVTRQRPPDRVDLSPEARDPHALSPEDQARVRALEQSDRTVRRHEEAHQAAGGSLASSPSFELAAGPDGGQYAVAGEVRIDSRPIEGDSAATIRKMQQVRRAALAPMQPSAQDRRVAAQAAAAEREARAELRRTRPEPTEVDRDDATAMEMHRGRAAVAAYRAADPGIDPASAFSLVA